MTLIRLPLCIPIPYLGEFENEDSERGKCQSSVLNCPSIPSTNSKLIDCGANSRPQRRGELFNRPTTELAIIKLVRIIR